MGRKKAAADQLPDRITGLKRVRAGDLIPNEKNWRRHTDDQRDALRGILERIGYAAALIAYKTEDGLVLIDGHLRAEDDPEQIVPVLVLDVSEEEADLLLTALDPLAAMATTDGDALSRLLEGLGGKEELDDLLGNLPDVGAALNALADGVETTGSEDDDKVPVAPEKPKSRLGDLWILGEHRLLCGDSLDPDDLALTLDGRKPDAVVTDPPYGMNLDTDYSDMKSKMGKGKAKGKKYNKVIGDDEAFDPSPILSFFSKCPEVFLFGPDYYAERIEGRAAGSWLVWDKRTDTQGDGYGSEFELIWSKAKHKRRVLRHEWFGFLSGDNSDEARNRVHPTQKPTSLLRDIVEQWVKGDVIVDPFMGSGSMIIAAEALDRVCVGIEIDPAYVDVAVIRWQNITGREAVLESTGKTFAKTSNRRRKK